eukprot:10301418-Karenia_brevis.AAC.1
MCIRDSAKDADFDIPSAKAFSLHGTPITKEVPLFHKTSTAHTSASTTSLTIDHPLQQQLLKQMRRLQSTIHLLSK